MMFTGKYLVEKVQEHPDLDLAFVWNRSPAALEGFQQDQILRDLKDFKER
jgi:hypothetical protein